MIMTGAMCVIAAGSSVQLLIGVLVTLLYMLLVLKAAPHNKNTEDWSSFIASFALTLTMIGGLVLILDDQNDPTYESNLLAIILIGINGTCIALEIFIVIFFDCGVGEKLHRKSTNNNVPMKNFIQVKPVESNNNNNVDDNATKRKVAAKKAWEY